MAKYDDPLFNTNFVQEIENHPCLWNYTLPEYSKRNETEKAWTEVSKAVKDSVSNCRDRWRNIRGAFLRSLKPPPSGSGSQAKKKYYLSEYLDFLLPYTKNTCSTGNLEALVNNNENSQSSFTDNEEHTQNQEIAPESQHSRSVSTTSPPLGIEDENFRVPELNETIIESNRTTPFKKKRTAQNSGNAYAVDTAFVEWLKRKNQEETGQENANLLFLRSLLPDIDKMTDKQNRRFRQKIIGLIDDILDNVDITPNHFLSCSNSSLNKNTRSSVVWPTPSPSAPAQVWPEEQEMISDCSGFTPINHSSNDSTSW